MGRKEGVLRPFRGGAGTRLIQCGLVEVYFRTKWRLQPSSRLDTIHMGKNWGDVPLLNGSGSPSNNVAWAWHLDPSIRLATIDVDRKLFWGGAGSPSNTMSPGPRPTFVPSGILIHPAVWPQ